ncbi:MAG: FAD-dependent oxidoreductase [Fusobacteriaceae bacterium]|nr:FAD-dependent oxidoreductase [Fusobacteriaceae bacterium]
MQVVTNAEVISIKEYSEDLREYIIKPEKYRRFDAGTFLQLALENVSASDYWPESRTFSMASAYNTKNKTIKLIIRKIGKYTKKIFEELKVGTTCTIKYAFGDMILPESGEVEVICIAAGSGIAPFLGFAEELKCENRLNNLKLLYTVRKETDLIGYNFFKENISDRNLSLFITDEVSDKGLNRLMNIKDILAKVENIETTHFYICGAPSFIKFFKDELKKYNIDNIHLDEWE